MQLKCSFCSMMFTLGKEEAAAALEKMNEEKLAHYDAHCPKCRRANKILKNKLLLAYPALKQPTGKAG